MSMVKYSPVALNFGYDFDILVHFFWDTLYRGVKMVEVSWILDPFAIYRNLHQRWVKLQRQPNHFKTLVLRELSLQPRC